ncbi:ABC transporter permease subunit [Iamia sp. SCSIO 61187]|uniref:ABC transporter permease n=1 Tax=Iamia sp. SCSIO 61187 TaxID=2722752 RepID=UPI001C634E55|nr:ABC transporter permease subunit [Iamia sp. SCSIO 61187]QYG93142.1 ABC transporter permease subunit [Iamia sp. SCSIO 61187]
MTAPQITTVAPGGLPGRGGGRLVVGVLRALVTFVVVTGLLLGLWIVFLDSFDVNAYVGKKPSAVWDWITDPVQGPDRQAELREATIKTLTEAGWGFVTGITAAVAVAVAFTLSKALERTFLPIALALRSVPIVAMVPLFAYVFGRGTLGSLVIISIITFFPALVLVSNGLRAVRSEAVELLVAYNAGTIRQLVKLRIPSALPSLMASAKVCAPLAILGSILNGWLSTGTGLGALMVNSTITAQYAQLWAAVVVVTIASIVFAALVSIVEQPVLARYAPDRLGG